MKKYPKSLIDTLRSCNDKILKTLRENGIRDEKLKKLKDISVNIDGILDSMDIEEFTIEEIYYIKLGGTDLEFCIPYLIKANYDCNRINFNTLLRHPFKKYCNDFIKGIIDNSIMQEGLLICPLPTDAVIGIHNRVSFHPKLVDELHCFLADTLDAKTYVAVLNELLDDSKVLQRLNAPRSLKDNFQNIYKYPLFVRELTSKLYYVYLYILRH